MKGYKQFLFMVTGLIFIFQLGASAQNTDIFKELEKKKKAVKSNVKKNKIDDGWNPGLASGIFLTQSGYKDWEKGGANSLSWAVNTDGGLIYSHNGFRWVSELNLAYGQSRIGSQGYRKTDDRLEFESTASQKMKKLLTPFVSFLLQTQLAPGYKYSYDKKSDAELRDETSGFWDPAYVYQSAGLSLQPVGGFGIRLGAAARETFTRTFRNYSDGKWYDVQAGVEFVADFDREIMTRTRLKSNLRLFSSFEKFETVQMVWENLLILKFNKLFSANLRAFLIYDPDISLRTQVKEILGIGILYNFFE